MIPVNRVPPLQSLIAGMVEVLGFLMLGGLFTAHITGNIVVIAALLVRGGTPNTPQVVAVPTYVAALMLVWLLAKSLKMSGQALLRPLLLVEFLVLGAVLLLAVSSEIERNPNTWVASLAAILATSAIACQFAMMRIAVPGAPSTAVMTGNLTNTVLAALDLLAPARPLTPPDAERFRETSVLVVAFCIGGLAGALAFLLLRGWAWSIPVILSAAALLVATNTASVGACHRRAEPLKP